MRGLELFGARFGPRIFVGRAAVHRAKSDRDDHAKENEEHDRPHPCGKQEARLLRMGECLVVRHG